MLYATPKNPLILALDFSDLEEACSWVSRLQHLVGTIKIGLELFTSCGNKALDSLSHFDLPIFLDLKLHDIPNTVARATLNIVEQHPYISMLTVHTAGGKDMLTAAQEVASGKIALIGVTVLTSLNSADLLAQHTEEYTLKLTKMAIDCGLYGVVCSSNEVPAIKHAFGGKIKTITPGIRYEADVKDDQKRVRSPSEALAMGADYLVLGRTVTRSQDPERVLLDILAANKSK